jgi:hypothetical protein
VTLSAYATDANASNNAGAIILIVIFISPPGVELCLGSGWLERQRETGGYGRSMTDKRLFRANKPAEPSSSPTSERGVEAWIHVIGHSSGKAVERQQLLCPAKARQRHISKDPKVDPKRAGEGDPLFGKPILEWGGKLLNGAT